MSILSFNTHAWAISCAALRRSTFIVNHLVVLFRPDRAQPCPPPLLIPHQRHPDVTGSCCACNLFSSGISLSERSGSVNPSLLVLGDLVATCLSGLFTCLPLSFSLAFQSALLKAGHLMVTEDKRWVTNTEKDVAVRIWNNKIAVAVVMTDPGFVKITIEGGVNIVGGYISPNIPIAEFHQRADTVIGTVDVHRGEFIVAGDLNAKSVEWGSPHTDARGAFLSNLIAAKNLSIHNDGKVPTCITPNGTSFIDVTLSTMGIAPKIRNWRVTEDESLSLHRHIQFAIETGSGPARGANIYRTTRNVDRIAIKRVIREALEAAAATPAGITPATLTATFGGLQNKHTTRRQNGNTEVPYWWNRHIEEPRKTCLRTRREMPCPQTR